MSTSTKIKAHAKACGWEPGQLDSLLSVSFRRPSTTIIVYLTISGAIHEVKIMENGIGRWAIGYQDKDKLSKIKALLSEMR